MAQPSANAGNHQLGMMQVQQALQLLELALPQLDPQSQQKQGVVRAISSLSAHFGAQKAEALAPAQLMQQMQAAQPSALQRMLAARQAQPPAA